MVDVFWGLVEYLSWKNESTFKYLKNYYVKVGMNLFY